MYIYIYIYDAVDEGSAKELSFAKTNVIVSLQMNIVNRTISMETSRWAMQIPWTLILHSVNQNW